MVNKLIFYIIIFFTLLSFGQDKITLHNQFNFNGKPLVLSQNYVLSDKDTLSFETIKMYVSNFEIIYTDDSFEKQKNSYHLLDYENTEKLNLELRKNPNKKIKAIKFDIGIDSLTNVSGAMGGDLDATNGMYWTWQSGYINIKIEGKSKKCATRKNQFQFHIGGYLQPFYSKRNVEFLVEDKKEYFLNFNIENLLSKINLSSFNTVMIPGKEAMLFSDIFKQIISIE